MSRDVVEKIKSTFAFGVKDETADKNRREIFYSADVCGRVSHMQREEEVRSEERSLFET